MEDYMLMFNIGFINKDNQEDETQLEVEERCTTEEQMVELFNLILSLKDEMRIERLEYIDCLGYAEDNDEEY